MKTKFTYSFAFFLLTILFLEIIFNYKVIYAATKSCIDLGGKCIDVGLCSSEIGEMIAGTECDKNGEICCKIFSPNNPPSENTENKSLIIENPLSPISDIWQLIMRLINIAQNIGIFVCVILIVWAGYLYVTSAGNEEKIKQAQRTLIWALVGFGIIIIAGVIPKWIYEFITGKKLNFYSQENNSSSENNIYSTSQALGGYIYNSTADECYWDNNAEEDDPECAPDLL
ncbi:MAG: pilin [Minisyncoccia bacterium]